MRLEELRMKPITPLTILQALAGGQTHKEDWLYAHFGIKGKE